MSETAVSSFIIRFKQEQASSQPAPWHGLIRHVQSRQEIHFTNIDDALQFMAQFVVIEVVENEDNGN